MKINIATTTKMKASEVPAGTVVMKPNFGFLMRISDFNNNYNNCFVYLETGRFTCLESDEVVEVFGDVTLEIRS